MSRPFAARFLGPCPGRRGPPLRRVAGVSGPKAATAPYRSGMCHAARHDRCRGDWGTAVCDCPCHTTPPPEPEPVTVRCFFGCGRQEVHEDPQGAHEAMEGHYFAAHCEQIRAAVGWVTP